MVQLIQQRVLKLKDGKPYYQERNFQMHLLTPPPKKKGEGSYEIIYSIEQGKLTLPHTVKMSVVLHKVRRCSQELAIGQSLLWSILSFQRIGSNLRLCVTSAYYDSSFYDKGLLATFQPQTGGPLLIRRPSLLFQYAGSYSHI